MTRRSSSGAILAIVVLAVLGPDVGTFSPPIGTHTELGLQGSAKVLCSAVFVSGRDPDEFARNSGFWFMPNAEADKVTYTVDRERKVVTTAFGGVTRSARYYGDQGCIIDRQCSRHRIHTSAGSHDPPGCAVAGLADGGSIADHADAG